MTTGGHNLDLVGLDFNTMHEHAELDKWRLQEQIGIILIQKLL